MISARQKANAKVSPTYLPNVDDDDDGGLFSHPTYRHIAQINWNKYLVNLLDDPLSDEEEIIVNVPTFFAKVDKLLLEVDSK